MSVLFLATLPLWLSSLSGDASGVLPLFLVGGSVVAIVRYSVKRFIEAVREIVQEEVRPMCAQLFPNGGSSISDRVDKVATKLDDHIADSNAARVTSAAATEQLNDRIEELMANR